MTSLIQESLKIATEILLSDGRDILEGFVCSDCDNISDIPDEDIGKIYNNIADLMRDYINSRELNFLSPEYYALTCAEEHLRNRGVEISEKS